MNKALLVVFPLLTSCAYATPVDILVPTKRPSACYYEYMGHLATTNVANKMYHSYVDTKYEKAMIPARQAELEGLRLGAKGELDFIDFTGNATSIGLYGLITAVLTATGIMMPRPQEKHKVKEALMQEPPKV